MVGPRLIAVALVGVAVLTGCGGDDAPEVPPVERKPEKPEQVGKLPPGWTVEENKEQGFELGSPPGWRSGGECLKRGGAVSSVTIICSPDKLVTLSVAADRTDEALELRPGEFAVRTMEGLADSYDGLEPGEPRNFKATYEGARVEGRGTAVGTGVDQNVTVVVLRREGAANFTAVIAANADKPTEPAVKLAEESLATLRSKPVTVPSG